MEPTATNRSDSAALAAEKQALHIQAAAVAAQQAALSEDEARLRQRRAALEKQESQLAAHLEEKRRQLVQLNEQARAAHASLQDERQAHAETRARSEAELDAAQQQLDRDRAEVRAQRQRLLNLQRRLRKRWHRKWLAERRALQVRHADLDKRESKLEQDKSAFVEARLAWNGEAELGRRQLADAWDKLRQGQQTSREQALALRDRQCQLEQWQTALEDERAASMRHKARLEGEIAGLETRARNLRQKLLGEKHVDGGQRAAIVVPAAPVLTAVPALPLSETERDWHLRLHWLGRLAGDLADQRLQLVEVWQRIVLAQDAWQKEYAGITADLGTLALRLPEVEQALSTREQAVAHIEADLRRRHEAQRRGEEQLAGQQARFNMLVAAWESRQKQLVADVQVREELAGRHLTQLVDLRQRWAKRRRQELDLIRVERAQCVRLRRECATLRADLCQRNIAMQEQKCGLTEETLALEQFRQECLTRAGDAASGERKVQKLRRRWLRQNTILVQAVIDQRQALQAELAYLEERYQALQKQMEQAAVREVNLDERHTAWEQTKLLGDVQAAKIRQELHHLEAQCACYERQLVVVQDEVERLAHLLLDDPLPIAA